MSQVMLHLVAPAAQLDALTSRLRDAGFAVGPSGRAAGGIHVRVREGTGDEAEVQAICDGVAPGITRGPPAAPTRSIVGYRE